MVKTPQHYALFFRNVRNRDSQKTVFSEVEPSENIPSLQIFHLRPVRYADLIQFWFTRTKNDLQRFAAPLRKHKRSPQRLILLRYIPQACLHRVHVRMSVNPQSRLNHIARGF